MPYIKMPRPVPVVSGQTVTLRPFDLDRDAADWLEMSQEPEMHLWTIQRVLSSVEEARAELARYACNDTLTSFAIQDNATGKVVGRFTIKLDQCEDVLVAREGNRIAKPYWRKGHNREARKLIFDYVFNTLRADCIETQCWTDNTNSRLSIIAHGFEFVREVAIHNEKYGKYMPVSCFVLTRDAWLESLK